MLSLFLVDNALRRQIDMRLSTESQALLNEPSLDVGISSRLSTGRSFRYRFVKTPGQKPAGDLETSTHQLGFFDLAFQEGANAESPDAFRALGTRVGDGYFVVALDTDDIENISDALIGTLGLMSACAVAFAIFGGRRLSNYFLGRLEQLVGTAEAITQGEATRRMPLAGSDDVFDRRYPRT